MTTTYETEVTLGNDWELGVEIDVLEYEPSYEGNWGARPEDYDPGSQGYVSLGEIRATEALEELGITRGQVIHPAYLLGGPQALTALELAALEEREGSGWEDGPDDCEPYEPEPYDGW